MRRTNPCDGGYWFRGSWNAVATDICSVCGEPHAPSEPVVGQTENSDLHSDLHDRIWNRSKRTTVMDGAGKIHQAIVVKESDLRELTAPSGNAPTPDYDAETIDARNRPTPAAMPDEPERWDWIMGDYRTQPVPATAPAAMPDDDLLEWVEIDGIKYLVQQEVAARIAELGAELARVTAERDQHKGMRELGWSYLECAVCGAVQAGKYNADLAETRSHDDPPDA